jgi:uncharacterized protein (TIGR03435 family)
MTAIAAAWILIKVTVIMALAFAGLKLARRSRAAVRHVLLAASFVVLLMLPIASIIAPAVSVAMPAAVQQAIEPLIVEPIVQDPPMPSTAGASPTTSAASESAWPSLSAFLLGSWIAGVAVFLLPVILGMRQVGALRRSAFPWLEGRAMADALAREIGFRRTIDLRLHEALPGPMTCGVFSPAIVLPMDAPAWPAEDLRRAMVHELEHVRRSDWLTQCLARIVAAGYWFHPAVWVAWRQLALEAERACDDAVLLSKSLEAGASTWSSAASESSTAYADQLVVLAQRLKMASVESGGAASRQPQLAMANRSDLATRVVAVLDSAQQRGRAGALCVGAAIAVTAVLAAGLSSIRIVAAAPAAQAAPITRQKFDAATIKPCVAEENPTGARGTAGGTNASFSPGRFFVPCVTTEQLIYLAYASYGAREDERLVNDDFGTASNATKIRGGPSWVHSLRDKYSIEATAVGATERTILMGAMLQSLLEDRFHLRIHRDTEEVSLLSLTVAKGGFKLKPMQDGDCEPNDGTPPPLGDLNTAKPRCGNLNMVGSEVTRWTFGGFTLSSLAGQLSRVLGVHVNDKTGITDKFVFRFEFRRGEDAFATEASILAALEEQLGLKLEKTKGPRGFIVIDAIERPTPDGPTVFMAAPSRARGAGRRP